MIRVPLFFLAFKCLVCGPLLAAELELSVKYDALPVANVVVYLEPLKELPQGFTYQSGISPEMSQQDKEFLPHILPVYKGSDVIFPNRDSISHHVYSFSSAKVFELELYKTLRHAPVIFEQTGVVTLGCNIHDWMLGYIVVLETPIFQKTNGDGTVRFKTVPSGEYRLKLWHPQLSEQDLKNTQRIKLTESQQMDIVLLNPLKNVLKQRTGFEDEEY